VRGTWREGSFTGDPEGHASVRLWKWVSVSIGTLLLGNMEGCSFPRVFERREKFLYLGKFL